MATGALRENQAETQLLAGTAVEEISPAQSIFLAGYPHVRRNSTGIHDPLLSSALYLESGTERVMFIANDIIYVPKALVARARARIAAAAGISAAHILISATHTHSGPKTVNPLATEADEAVPPADVEYLQFLEEQIVKAGIRAAQHPQPAEVGLAIADATGVGTNRRNPSATKDLQVPVMVVRDLNHRPLAAMLVCSMHPTVLHEDSTLVSGDFPGLARQYLQKHVLGENCVVLYHTGPAGNQSPRHVTRANNFAEAERLGRILGEAAEKVIGTIRFQQNIKLQCRQCFAQLPLKIFPSEAEARAKVEMALAHLQKLRDSNAPRTDIRTAEVDWFGATETLTLSRAAAEGRLAQAAQSCLPAEIQALLIGPWTFVAWQGELFVEFSLEVKKHVAGAFPISYANGELQGYLVTEEAVKEGGYESSNAIFKSPDGGRLLVEKTLELLADRCRDPD
ncbi:MAG TPA: neutral/alkaline non-lysosomal ceramidase N-terminal domain-containing protein [Tepidisphaeraceae bacterium]